MHITARPDRIVHVHVRVHVDVHVHGNRQPCTSTCTSAYTLHVHDPPSAKP